MCLSSVAVADDIAEAFGMTLGTQFNVGDSEGKTVLPNGTIEREFIPEPKFRAFTNYWVWTAPKTEIIYGIKATGPFGSVEEARKEQGLVMDLLREKYPQATSAGRGGVERISQGSRYIETRVTDKPDPKLEIHYGDSAIEEQLREDKLKTKESKTNASGL